jgi:hypothetical protein
MSETCAQTGEAICAVDCQCKTQSPTLPLAITPKPNNTWQTIRSSAAFAVACITSPCCTPIIVPIVIALLAGTPIAGFLSLYIGWVYGILTLVSIVSLVLAIRWWAKQTTAKPVTKTALMKEARP